MSNPRATTASPSGAGENDPRSPSNPSVESVGSRLRNAREAQEITEKEAAKKLQLMVTDLRAIEADRYHASVNDDLLRQHLRDYANFVQLNPDSIIAIHDLHRDCESLRIDAIPSAQSNTFKRMLTGALVVVTLLSGLLALLHFTKINDVNSLLTGNSDDLEGRSQRSGSSKATAANVADTNLSPAFVVREAANKQAETPANGDAGQGRIEQAQAQTIVSVVSTRQAQASATADVATNSDANSDADAAVDKAAVKAVDELAFRFAKDCWVEVYDADEQRLIAQISKAGGSLLLSGKSPFKVLVGRSRDVVLQFNDQPVDIENIDRSSSTLFTVGRAGNDPNAPLLKTIRRKLPN